MANDLLQQLLDRELEQPTIPDPLDYERANMRALVNDRSNWKMGEMPLGPGGIANIAKTTYKVLPKVRMDAIKKFIATLKKPLPPIDPLQVFRQSRIARHQPPPSNIKPPSGYTMGAPSTVAKDPLTAGVQAERTAMRTQQQKFTPQSFSAQLDKLPAPPAVSRIDDLMEVAQAAAGPGLSGPIRKVTLRELALANKPPAPKRGPAYRGYGLSYPVEKILATQTAAAKWTGKREDLIKKLGLSRTTFYKMLAVKFK